MYRNNVPSETYLIILKNLPGKALAETVLTEIGNFILDFSNCHGQGYVGAASVSGHINGLSAHTIRINPKDTLTVIVID